MKPQAPLTPKQRARRERALLAEQGPRTLAGEPRLSRADEQAITDKVRAAEAATNDQRLAQHLVRMTTLTDELATISRSLREHRLIDRRLYSNLDRDIRSLNTTRRRLSDLTQ
jgi:hypothetical protein